MIDIKNKILKKRYMSVLSMELQHGTDTFLSTSLFILKYVYGICYTYRTE